MFKLGREKSPLKQPQPGPSLRQAWVHQQACPTEAGHWDLSVPPPFHTGFFPFTELKKTETFLAIGFAQAWDLPDTGLP